MEDRLDQLFDEWNEHGAAVLVASGRVRLPPRTTEDLIAESTDYCRESGRLMWVVLDWLMRHVEEIDEKQLVNETEKSGDISVLGVLADAARERRPHPKFDRIVRQCSPNATLDAFFHRVERSPLALRLTQENPLEIFLRWNYLSRELRYLEDEFGPSADRPKSHRLDHARS